MTEMLCEQAVTWIRQLNLRRHPEGGYFSEYFRSPERLPQDERLQPGPGLRSLLTCAYFLLPSGEHSAFHRLCSDELFLYHAGGSLTVHLLDPDGVYTSKVLAPPPDGSLHVLAPKRHWFGATVNGQHTYSLFSCVVAPGFEFADFELGERDALVKEYPKHEGVINALTKE